MAFINLFEVNGIFDDGVANSFDSHGMCGQLSGHIMYSPAHWKSKAFAQVLDEARQFEF